MILFLILLAINGLIVGALARLALPGRDPMTIPQTILDRVAQGIMLGSPRVSLINVPPEQLRHHTCMRPQVVLPSEGSAHQTGIA